MIEDNRTTNFCLLQADLESGRTDRMALCLFDLLCVDGRDLQAEPLFMRKQGRAISAENFATHPAAAFKGLSE